ncbi:MAG: MerR family transcriptional regulator [Solirubrobacteraceae bacterium]
MSATAQHLRIGELASAAGTTTRTVRYYEEIGLLPGSAPRPAGSHRLYEQADLERLREIVRLRDLLGVPLEQLKELVEAEDARAALRAEYVQTEDRNRRAEILAETLGHLDRQLELVRGRTAELQSLEQDLVARRRRVSGRIRSR